MGKLKDLSFTFLQKYIKLTIQKDLELVLITATLAEFQDLLIYLQPEVKKLKSYDKDTTDYFIKKIEAIDRVSDHSYLVSLDVCSLYINIAHKEGIEAVK